MKSLPMYLVASLIVAVGLNSMAMAKPSSISIPETIKQQTPTDAFALVYIPSLETSLKAVGQTAAAVDPQLQMMVQMGPAMMLPQLMKQAKGGPVPIDMGMPMAIAVSPSASGPMGDPAVTMMVGVKGSTDGLESTNPKMRVETTGGPMVILTDRPEGAALGGSAGLFENIPAGDVSVAIDQAKAVKLYGPMIQSMGPMMMGSNPGETPSKVQQQQMKQAMAQMQMFLDMFASWDFGFTFKGGEMDITARWELTDPSKKAEGAADFGPIASVLTSKDAGIGAIMSRGFLDYLLNADAMSAASFGMDNPSMKMLYKMAHQAVKGMTSSTGMYMGLSEKGLWGLQTLKVADADTYLSEVNNMVTEIDDANIGISVSNLPLVNASGKGYLMKVDAARMLELMDVDTMVDPKDVKQMQAVMDALLGGDKGMPVRYLYEGKQFVVVWGLQASTIAEAKQILAGRASESPNALTELVASAQGSPTIVAAADVRKLLSQLVSLLRGVSAIPAMERLVSIPAGDPVMVTATATAMQKGGQLIATLDVAGLAEINKAITKGQMEHQERQKAAMKN